jgi:hypothetical protein
MRMRSRGQPGKSVDTEATGATTHVAFLLDTSVIARIEARMPELTTPGRKPTLAGALRALVLVGLGELEQLSTSEQRA